MWITEALWKKCLTLCSSTWFPGYYIQVILPCRQHDIEVNDQSICIFRVALALNCLWLTLDLTFFWPLILLLLHTHLVSLYDLVLCIFITIFYSHNLKLLVQPSPVLISSVLSIVLCMHLIFVCLGCLSHISVNQTE